ncbi:MAG TPA: hypothetical protein VGR27_03320 [Longimicrobiaceae bacterium]|nr:hypothetical protein [Longimicrobiaceae bacterium]
MSPSERTIPCRNCERLFPDEELDRLRWCPSCRQVVIRRANLWARGVGLLAGLAAAAWVTFGIGPSPRFPLVLWLVLIVAVYYFTMKIIRRIAFEVIRSRGVPPAEA